MNFGLAFISRKPYKARRRHLWMIVLQFVTTSLCANSISDAPQHLDKLETAIKGLDKAKANQKPGSADAREVLIDALRLDVQNITRTAIAYAQDDPAFASL